MNLTDRQLHVVLAALRVAVEEYWESAANMQRDQQDELKEQFARQATEAQDLIDTLEECGIG